MRCAIVGSGLAALATYATLRHGGVRPEVSVVFGTHEDPTDVWRTRAAAIHQQRMRSESDGHLAPAAFPGLAVREALRRGSPAPLLRSVANRYHPSVDDFLAHAETVRRRTGWERSFRPQRVERFIEQQRMRIVILRPVGEQFGDVIASIEGGKIRPQPWKTLNDLSLRQQVQTAR